MRDSEKDPNRSVHSFRGRDCSRVRRLLDDYLSEELSIESNREILSHLDLCADCRRELKSRRRLRGRLAEAWNSQELPPRLEDRILHSLGGSRPLWRRPAAWAAALLLLFLGSGILLWTVSED